MADTTFIVHSDWLDSLKELPIEEQDKIIADTIRYGLDREIIHGDDPRVQAFVKMKSKDIDYSKEKYEQKKNPTITVRLQPEEKEQLLDFAKHNNMTISQVIRFLIRNLN